MRARLTSPSLWMAASTTFVFVVGWIAATATPGPLLTADDLAYFGLAWTMSGEGAAPMPPQAPYGLLYPLTLVPGWLAGFDDGQMLGWARFVNALCGALTVPVLAAFLRRFDGVGPFPALAAATAGAMMPAFLLTGSIAWSERLLVLLVACAALVIAKAWDDATPATGALAILTAAAMFAAHPRLGPPALVLVVVVAVALRDLGWPRVVSVLGGGAAALWMVERIRAAVADAAFASDGTYDAADLASRRGLDLVPEMAQLGVGTLSYLVIAGTGIAVWGVVRLAERRPVGWSVLVLGLAVLAIASWFITGIPRADKWFHGRYIEVMAPVVLAVGLVHLQRLRWRMATVVLFVVPVLAGIYAAWNGPGDNWLRARSPVMMLGAEVSGAPYGSRVFEPGAAALVAIVVGLAVWGLARWRGTELAAAVLVVVSIWGAHSGDRALDNLFPGTAMGEVDAGLPTDEQIDELWVDTSTVSPNLTNALAWRVGFESTSLTFTADTTHLLIPSDAQPPDGAVLVAEFTQGTLWRLPS
ncbi:MAG: hypothetical protein AAF081_09480 [Actinomycetota bacterium]